MPNTPSFDKKAWISDSKKIVKRLKKQNFPITVAELRRALESAAYADNCYPKIEQWKWENMLDTLIEEARKCRLSTGLYEHWQVIRDEAPYGSSQKFSPEEWLEVLEAIREG